MYFTSGRTHVTHTTVTTQQFQSSAVLFGSFLDTTFTPEKTTEQTRGGEKLGVETWHSVHSEVFISCGAFTERTTTEGNSAFCDKDNQIEHLNGGLLE